ncbi:hypothetical protein [Caulobacter sp. 17J65-9]|uniref:hypothetical protein n=1 Tax=Caulobacter sp. 17J65-9 TaxID=2709382 RepID=UPI0013C9BCEE|nr:hypothetical protein [Caulobacter sp. 17J65-9]NEX93733.1 hypothetical protein [Caulobacter sp. 17J65-9]
MILETKRTTGAVCLLAALLFGNAASAGEFKAAPNASYVVDLDTPDGNFSLWQADDLTGLNALRTNVTFARLGKDKTYAPHFAVALENDKGRVVLGASVLKGKVMIVTLTTWQGDKQTAQEMFMLPPEPSETFALDLDWTPDGVVTAVIHSQATKDMNGFERHQARLDGAPARLEITGSTAEVEFKPLKLGSTTP